MYADENVIKIKHEVLYEVAKLAFDGELETKKEEIPYKLIPGPKAQFRCCIYREREIIRERIKLCKGETLYGNADNIMQVIKPACEDCPISSYTVTENCQNCMGKACINACKFGAIESGRHRSHIDPMKCKECGKCAEACPYNAIAHLVRPCKNSCPVGAITYDENGISVIDEEKCIRCGKCIHSCPFGAIGSKTFIVQVIAALKDESKNVYAMLAPATEGQFGKDITMASLKTAAKKLGFVDCYEAGIGGDMTAYYEAQEWMEAYEQGEKKVTSCCPGFVNMVRRHYPELSEKISTTVSPMCAVSRMIKAKDPNAVVVFIGPCIAKKSEVVDQKIEGNADYVLTYSELRSILRAKKVEILPEENSVQEASKFGKRFGNSGGVTAAVVESMKEMNSTCDPKVCVANGAAECKKALLLLKAGRLPEDFVEGMACEGGCVGGPSSYAHQNLAKKSRDELISMADDRLIKENLDNYDMTNFKMHREE